MEPQEDNLEDHKRSGRYSGFVADRSAHFLLAVTKLRCFSALIRTMIAGSLPLWIFLPAARSDVSEVA